MAYEDGPVGVGGWMWLFLFGFALVNPAMLLFGTYSNLYVDPSVAQLLGSGWGFYQLVEWTIAVVTLGVIYYVVWRLFNLQNRQTVRLTQLAIPFVGLGITLFDIVFTATMAKLDIGLLFSALGVDLGRGVVYCVVWVSYFQVSKRVKNTYRDHDPDDTAQVFA